MLRLTEPHSRSTCEKQQPITSTTGFKINNKVEEPQSILVESMSLYVKIIH